MTGRTSDVDEITAVDRKLEAFMSAYWRWFKRTLRELGLSPVQHHALRLLAHHECMRMSEITERLGLSFGSTSNLIDRVVAHGWATREAISGDRRWVGVRVSPAGHAKLDEVTGALTQSLEATLGALSPEAILALETFSELLLPQGSPPRA